jgi:3-isopropylmalate dehydratase small subunit
MHQMKVRAIVAKSFGRQFFRNAINNGLPVFECDTSSLVQGQSLELDLAKGVLCSQGRVLQETHPLPPEILAILSMGGLVPFLQKYPDWNFA